MIAPASIADAVSRRTNAAAAVGELLGGLRSMTGELGTEGAQAFGSSRIVGVSTLRIGPDTSAILGSTRAASLVDAWTGVRALVREARAAASVADDAPLMDAVQTVDGAVEAARAVAVEAVEAATAVESGGGYHGSVALGAAGTDAAEFVRLAKQVDTLTQLHGRLVNSIDLAIDRVTPILADSPNRIDAFETIDAIALAAREASDVALGDLGSLDRVASGAEPLLGAAGSLHTRYVADLGDRIAPALQLDGAEVRLDVGLLRNQVDVADRALAAISELVERAGELVQADVVSHVQLRDQLDAAARATRAARATVETSRSLASGSRLGVGDVRFVPKISNDRRILVSQQIGDEFVLAPRHMIDALRPAYALAGAGRPRIELADDAAQVVARAVPVPDDSLGVAIETARATAASTIAGEQPRSMVDTATALRVDDLLARVRSTYGSMADAG